MTKRNIDRHIENLSPFVKELQRAAFRAGAEAVREQIDEWLTNQVGLLSKEKIASLRALPLPEMDE